MKGHDYLLGLGSLALAAFLVLVDAGWQGQVWAQPGEPVPEVAAITSMPAQRFYIKSQDPLVKSRFVVKHQFPTVFSAVSGTILADGGDDRKGILIATVAMAAIRAPEAAIRKMPLPGASTAFMVISPRIFPAAATM